MEKFYRGYVLVRLSKVGEEWKITDKLMKLKDKSGSNSWKVTYATPIYGAWDLICEVSFKKLEDLDIVVTALRADTEIREIIEETTTLVSSKSNFPMDE